MNENFSIATSTKLFVKLKIVIFVKIGEYLSYNTKIHLILAICGKKTQNNEKLGQADSH